MMIAKSLSTCLGVLLLLGAAPAGADTKSDTGTIQPPPHEPVEVGNQTSAAQGRCTRKNASLGANSRHECMNLGGTWSPAPSAKDQGGNGAQQPEGKVKRDISKDQPPGPNF